MVQRQVVVIIDVQSMCAMSLADAVVATDVFEGPVMLKPPYSAPLTKGFMLAAPHAGDVAVEPVIPGE